MSHPRPGILMICPDYKPNVGGEAELAFALARALRDRGNRITVLAPAHPGGAPEDAELPGAVARELDLGRFPPLSTVRGWLAWPGAMAGLLRTVRRRWRATASDVCLVTTYMTWPTLALRLLNLPYGLFLHGEDVSLNRRRGGWVWRLFASACLSARRIFFNSEFSRERLLAWLPEVAARTEAVGCGVRTDIRWTTDRRAEARRDLGWDDGPVLLTIANLYQKKGIQTVIRALPEIRRFHSTVRYVVVGEGPEAPTLRAIARKEDVTGHVVFRERLDSETKEKLYAASDVYVMISEPGEWGDEEGFGITFLEANWHGLPVVGSRCGGIPESVEDGISGLLVDPGAPDQVCAAVRRLLDDPRLRRDLVRGGRRRIEERLNWPTISGRIEDGLRRPAGPVR
jgi:phosphatidylinositol alpha-1,6-mannosyltransferase